MNRGEVALGIFVKTPGLSPVKTRLAAGIGEARAVEFYERSFRAVEAVALQSRAETPALVPVWAVAEEVGLDSPRWKRFGQRGQGTGGLGERMARVYEALRAECGTAILIGADMPLLSTAHLKRACRILAEPATPVVLGGAEDGGFYLFGGREAVPAADFAAVRCGAADTVHQFWRRLARRGGVGWLETLPDVDSAADVAAVLAHPGIPRKLLPEQQELLEWFRGLSPAAC